MNNETALSLATLVVAGLALFLLLLWVSTAPAETVCLTKKEARQLWPRQHLYWYSKDHCWSNRRGPPRNLKFDPVFSKAHAEEAAPKHDKGPGSLGSSRAVVKIVKPDEFNEIDAAADSDTYFRAEPFPSFFGVMPPRDNFELIWQFRIEGHLQ